MKLFLTLAAATAIAVPQLSAFDFQVKSIERVPVKNAMEVYHPVFTPDGKSLVVSSEAYNGLGIVNLENGDYKQLSDREGAGYKYAMNEDGTQIVLRENDFLTQKLSLYLVDVESAKEECIVPVAEHTNTLKLTGGVVAYAEPIEKKVLTRVDPALRNTLAAGTVASQPLLTEEDLKMVLYVDGKRTVVDPMLTATGRDDFQYCWSSISPDGSRLLFCAGNNTYTSDLDGGNLVDLGPIHAPVWRGDNTVVAMLDSDDGHFFTASDIVAADAHTAERVQLTPQTDEIKMFPSVSPDGNRIAFHTTDGKLYIINLETK